MVRLWWKFDWDCNRVSGLPSYADDTYILWDPMSKFVVEEGFGMAVADLSVVFFVCSQLRV